MLNPVLVQRVADVERATCPLEDCSPKEAIERLLGVTEASRLESSVEQPVGADGEFVGDEACDQIQVGQLLGLGFTHACFHGAGHSAQTQLPERSVYFDEVHSGFSFVMWLMYVR